MKALLFVTVLAAMTVTAFAADDAAPYWVAICRGDKDANYTQTAGGDGDGAFSQNLGDGTYQTVKLKMSTYKPDHVVCGAVPGHVEIAEICADNDRQVIFFRLRDKIKPKKPLRDVDYCTAAVRIH